ncbi:uncharacterized protein MELLADRAFT_90752 [Melampsora larici-populina 98AG31]|uniref:Uncharacterized protein n=1 Tax=Melampsora larici-populina (strain 98AG31 / pathotype 3-4-7) TaxID=747676 RepID=F4R7C9_MELLP|nr:uncharacterized protein MELLADRAFT_90752 [Melampsora larici-populina 98AG31]EGG11293.1 hypothetical protein MELLADRAFT_90752 [Melampsora larici-populina 98AG31]
MNKIIVIKKSMQNKSLIIPAAIDAHRFCESTQSDTAIFSRLCPAIKGKRRSASIMLEQFQSWELILQKHLTS